MIDALPECSPSQGVVDGSRRDAQPKTRRRQKRELPDLRPKVIGFPEPADSEGRQFRLPDEDKIEALRRQHRFPETFNFAWHLEWAWEWWRHRVQKGPDAPATVRKDFLHETANRAKALEEAIDRAGSAERPLLFEALGGHKNLDLKTLRELVHKLWLAASVAERRVAPSPSGRRGQPELNALVGSLLQIFLLAFGRRTPRISKVDQYDGRFFRFVRDVLQAFDAPKKNNEALGKVIEKAIAVWKDAGRPIWNIDLEPESGNEQCGSPLTERDMVGEHLA